MVPTSTDWHIRGGLGPRAKPWPAGLDPQTISDNPRPRRVPYLDAVNFPGAQAGGPASFFVFGTPRKTPMNNPVRFATGWLLAVLFMKVSLNGEDMVVGAGIYTGE